MFEIVSNNIKAFDADLSGLIKLFLKGYVPYENPPFFAAHLTDFTKIVIYSTFILLPLLFIKFLFPYKHYLSYLIYFIVGIAGLAVFGILLGFIQLLYYF